MFSVHGNVIIYNRDMRISSTQKNNYRLLVGKKKKK